MSQAVKKKSLPVYLWVLIGGILLFGLLYLISPQRGEVNPEQLPWNASVNAQGQVTALGLTLNHTSLAEAKQLYGQDTETKIFSQKDESLKSLEVYFPSVYIGSIHGALVLKMNVPPLELEQMYTRGSGTTVNQAGNREVTISSGDSITMNPRTFSSLTLVPRKDLPERAIRLRFGEPERIEKQDDGLNHWFYPKMGLEILENPEGGDALQYGVISQP